MGCDGGTIPKRHELVKGPKKVEKVDKNAELVARWYYCSLSQQKLEKPIVSCDLGKLYNKDVIIEYLLDKSPDKTKTEASSHIRSIKDVKELNLADNPAWKGDKGNAKGDKYDDLQCARFICPIVGLEMNGKHKFCYLRSCGCVFSVRALKEIKTEVCHKCAVAFQEEDIIILNGNKEEVEELRKRMEERRLKVKLAKKLKKSKTTESTLSSEAAGDFPGPSKIKDEKKNVSAETKTGNVSEKDTVNGHSSSSGKISKSASGTTKRPITDQVEKSEVYKSIFTSHSSAKRSKDQSSHWVTHTAYLS
ncbi:replication termination factor 2 [Latimeria chalumnae]|uniref:replication termination factor 2 n=1 Tax=Latimeria chalumnae TaxID=7897 RepID=UPI0006D9004A|nr:PREDICTED: protein RTF2 homolog [Latimeria chalumnae]|eukprot:XP_014340828.1 PREDICTED: protein RTF2 homolog [Latimeria chalumnae]